MTNELLQNTWHLVLAGMQHNIQDTESILKFSVLWRGKKFIVEMNSCASLQDFGYELQKLTDVKADTMRLIIPQFSNKSSKLLYPFSDEYSSLKIQGISRDEGKTIRMMGVPEIEVDEMLENEKRDLRIPGFEEGDKRLRRRMLGVTVDQIKLPQGEFIFADFRTLEIPGVKLTPPPSEALKRMHMLAADPGIVAIMNKYRWRVGVMTEMAPVGYVGVSPKCLLGFNKNCGEEISLRLRTDDLKGFRKYETIKKTLLHELAHMVYSEHDANFYALDKQLNQEVASLDWTRSGSRTLNGSKVYNHHDNEDYISDISNNLPQKLGGDASDKFLSARETSVAAAYRRMENSSIGHVVINEEISESVPDESGFDLSREEKVHAEILHSQKKLDLEPDPDDYCEIQRKFEPDPDDSQGANIIKGSTPRDDKITSLVPRHTDLESSDLRMDVEPDPDDSHAIEEMTQSGETMREPDPDDSERLQGVSGCDDKEHGIVQTEPDPDDNLRDSQQTSGMQIDEPDPDDQELLKRIQDPVAILCSRMQNAIVMLQNEVGIVEASRVLQTLVKIIGNVIEHPYDMKYKRLRKRNPIIQRHFANYKAAMDILALIGFNEDTVLDDIGRSETYLVLKRNDPGLLWLAKSSIETVMA
ncbi:hypothetical protein SAY87_030145 [Trapa incisa]|uniref:WLM domain-containing protein n=1 Tax=Trapa incisa TaxID=236973 RepID=A0AAN7KE05_9MYRT|nr:hypothetical protein SAY87_030145 [Trapa incisa]